MPQINILSLLCIRRKQTTTMFATNQPPKNIGFFGVFGGSLELTSPHFGTFIKQLLGNEFFINMRKIALVIVHNPIVKRILQNIRKLGFCNRIATLTVS